MSISEILAAHAIGLKWNSLPEIVRDCARIFLLDTLAVGVAGAAAPFADAIHATEAAGSTGAAIVFGRAGTISARSAAFVNAYQIHAQEFDCVHEAAVLHPYSAVLGALAADCTARSDPVDGPSFATALVAGVDISVSLGLAARSPLKFFRPATAGIFGATAAVARVRGLTLAQTVAAMGHALSFAAGTMQAHVEGTPGLALQVAAAARGAIVAADLAQAGVPAAAMSIEGPFGYLNLFETAHHIEHVLTRLGRDFAVTELSHKPYPTGRAAHGGIAAVQTLLRAHHITAANIGDLCYIAPGLIARLVGRPERTDMPAAYARLCLPYLAAHTLLHGNVGLHAFAPAALADTTVLELASRVTVAVDNNPDPAAFTPACLRANLNDGRAIEVPVPFLPGSPQAPLDAPARIEKIRQCLAFGGLTLGAEALAGHIDKLDHVTDIAALLALASHPPQAQAQEKHEEIA
jgi:2-methylcitrate dehydratase PrpD